MQGPAKWGYMGGPNGRWPNPTHEQKLQVLESMVEMDGKTIGTVERLRPNYPAEVIKQIESNLIPLLMITLGLDGVGRSYPINHLESRRACSI